jgi:hypothetical protein
LTNLYKHRTASRADECSHLSFSSTTMPDRGNGVKSSIVKSAGREDRPRRRVGALHEPPELHSRRVAATVGLVQGEILRFAQNDRKQVNSEGSAARLKASAYTWWDGRGASEGRAG